MEEIRFDETFKIYEKDIAEFFFVKEEDGKTYIYSDKNGEIFKEDFLLKQEPVFVGRREIFIVEKKSEVSNKTVYYINFDRELEYIREIKLEFNSLKKTILSFILCYVFYFKNDTELMAYTREFNYTTKKFDYFQISFIDINGEIKNSIALDENFEKKFIHLSRLIHSGFGIGFKYTKNPIELDYKYFVSNLEWWIKEIDNYIVSEEIKEKVLNTSIKDPLKIISLMECVDLSKIDKVYLIDIRQEPPFWAESFSGYNSSLFLLESDLFQLIQKNQTFLKSIELKLK